MGVNLFGCGCGCIDLTVVAFHLQQAPKEDKGYWMFTHKSLGLLTAMVVAPRLVYRVYNRAAYRVEEVQGSSAIETIASKAAHYGLYAFMIIMPVSGVAMGYYGGKGLPFFYTTFSSPVPADDAQKKTFGEIAKNVSSGGQVTMYLFRSSSLLQVYSQHYLAVVQAPQANWYLWKVLDSTSRRWGAPALGTRSHHLQPHQPIPHWTWSLNRCDVHLLLLPISELSCL